MEIGGCQRLTTITSMKTANHQIWIPPQFLCLSSGLHLLLFPSQIWSVLRKETPWDPSSKKPMSRFACHLISTTWFKLTLALSGQQLMHGLEYDNEVEDLIHKHFFMASLSFTQPPRSPHSGSSVKYFHLCISKHWHAVEMWTLCGSLLGTNCVSNAHLLCIRPCTKRGLISKPITTLHEFCTRT